MACRVEVKGNVGANKDLENIFRRARRQGWKLFRDGAGHIRCESPDGVTVITAPLSSGSQKAVMNYIRRFRKAGVR